MTQQKSRFFANVYRPRIFDEVVGQEMAVRVLKESIRSKLIYGSYILRGPFGTGKTTLARIFANRLLCTAPNGVNPCFQCEACQSFAQQNNSNYLELDAATHSGVGDIRKVQDFANAESWGESDYKVIVCDESHDLSNAAQNSLLKTLEEAREGLVFIFATTEGDAMLDTVTSRSIVCDLTRPSIDQIQARMEEIATKEGIKADPLALRLIVAQTDLHLRDAIKDLEIIASCHDALTRDVVIQYYGLDESHRILDFFKIIKVNMIEAMNLAHSIANRGGVEFFLKTANIVLADIFRVKFRHYDDLKVLDAKADKDKINSVTQALGRDIVVLARFLQEVIQSKPDLDSLYAIVLYMNVVVTQKFVIESNVKGSVDKDLDRLQVPIERNQEMVNAALEDVDTLYRIGKKQRAKQTAVAEEKELVAREGDFIDDLWTALPGAGSKKEDSPFQDTGVREEEGRAGGSARNSKDLDGGTPRSELQEVDGEISEMFPE